MYLSLYIYIYMVEAFPCSTPPDGNGSAAQTPPRWVAPPPPPVERGVARWRGGWRAPPRPPCGEGDGEVVMREVTSPPAPPVERVWGMSEVMKFI